MAHPPTPAAATHLAAPRHPADASKRQTNDGALRALTPDGTTTGPTLAARQQQHPSSCNSGLLYFAAVWVLAAVIKTCKVMPVTCADDLPQAVLAAYLS